jgi:hypothetical protein
MELRYDWLQCPENFIHVRDKDANPMPLKNPKLVDFAGIVSKVEPGLARPDRRSQIRRRSLDALLQLRNARFLGAAFPHGDSEERALRARSLAERLSSRPIAPAISYSSKSSGKRARRTSPLALRASPSISIVFASNIRSRPGASRRRQTIIHTNPARNHNGTCYSRLTCARTIASCSSPARSRHSQTR